jgi:hypothetical protein
MFRRRRAASFRPPASSAWWPAAAEPPGTDGEPALPSGDPFDGWPAFPPAPSEPADPVLGSSEPLLGRPDPPGGWGVPGDASYPPGAFPASPVPPGDGGWGRPGGADVANADRVGPGRLGRDGGRSPAVGQGGVLPRPGQGGGQPPAGGQGGTIGRGSLTVVPVDAGQPPGPSLPATAGSRDGDPRADRNGLAAGWTPLLTHADDSQPFTAVRDEELDLDLAAGLGVSPDDPVGTRPATSKVRAARRRAARARRAAEADRNSLRRGGGPVPLDPPPDPALAEGVTTWLDPVTPPNPMEAAALAGAFAADYLSWDETNPQRRGEVLTQYLPSDVVGNAALLGWSGKGRQRAEFALPGAVHPDGDGRVVVDVRVRVTPYRAVGQPAAPGPAGELEVAGVPAVAPAPTARGWKNLDSHWVRMTVPITYDRGRLVVDTWDEQLDQDGEPARSPDDGPARSASSANGPRPARATDPATADDLDDPPVAADLDEPFGRPDEPATADDVDEPATADNTDASDAARGRDKRATVHSLDQPATQRGGKTPEATRSRPRRTATR